VLIGAVVFGLSTDYETFLLSRMVEARKQGASGTDAIRTGLLRTGRMISSAALLLIVVTGAFGLSQLSTMRFLGVGMIVALVLDATVVRMMLVPAVLRLVGDAAWWAPRWPRSVRDARHRGGPRLHDQPLHAERHRDVEQQGGGRQALGRTTVVDQHVGTEVHPDRDQP
jgi:trehalose monomycolate/heme transporter